MCKECEKLKAEIASLQKALAITEHQWRERGVRILALETLIAEIDMELQ